MTNPEPSHTELQRPPDNTKRHPGTTPVPVFVADTNHASGLKMKNAPVYEALRDAFKVAETMPGFPRIGEVLSGDLRWKKDTRWSTGDGELLALAAEVLLLARLLADPGVQRIAGLLTELKDAS